jgi:hypothetical protein
MQDVHRLADYTKKDNVNQAIGENDYYLPFNSNSFYKENNKDFYNNYTQDLPYYNNFSNDYSNYGNYNSELFSYPNLDFQIKENRKLNLDDKIKIYKVLKILEISLKNYPKLYVARTISWLRSSCFREQSDEPLKKYLVKRNMGDLWPYEK